MSDTMLLGVLRMPIGDNPDPITLAQFVDRARQAADRIESDTEEIERLREDYQRIISEVLKCDPIPASERPDDKLEPPWEVVARIRSENELLREVAEQAKTLYRETLDRAVAAERENKQLRDAIENHRRDAAHQSGQRLETANVALYAALRGDEGE